MLKWVLVTVLTGHGLLHLLGAVKGLGWAPVALLAQPIDAGAGAVWLVAALLILLAALMFARGTPPWWWAVALLGAWVSQIAIATSWGDAKFGTIANVLLVLLAGYGFAALGPTSFRTQWRGAAAEALADAEGSTSVVSEHDLAGLPGPLAAYVRRSGAVGRPRTTSLQARFHGRMRSAPGQAWMPFTGIQVNTFGPRPRRVFLMDASRAGLPVTVLHSFKNGTATMRAKLLSVLTVVDASGAEMDRGETVTVFNDLVVLAPAAIVDAPVQWAAVDAHHVRGTFVNGGQTVSAVLTFDADHDLVDFVSEDRLRASPDGTSFTRQEWSTPLSGHRYLDGRRILLTGRGQWHAPAPEGSFTYVELCMDQIAYNVGRTPPGTSPGVS